jgi:isochorismate hydrolase
MDYLEQIKRYNIRLQNPAPERAALLVINMQRYFEPMTDSISANVGALIRVCRASGMPIFFTRHGHKDPEQDNSMLLRWWGESIRIHTPAWEWVKTLAPLKTDRVIDKQHYSAFTETDLADRLEALEVQELIICGVMTNCCCETTARDAFMRDYRVFFISDATATFNAELHIASLKNLAFGFAHVVSTRMVLQHLDHRSRR